MSKIIFFGLKNWYIHRLWEDILAKHLELNEHDVILYSYTKMFGGDDLNNGRPLEHIHKHIASKTGETVNQMFQLKNVRRIEDAFSQQDLNNAENIMGAAGQQELETLEYKGIPLGKCCRNSTVRQSHCTDNNGPTYQKFFKENISTALYMTDAFEKVLVTEKPDAVFIMNGIMFMENILIHICKKLGIRIVSYERAARPQHLYITANEPVNDFMFDKRFDINKPLNEDELKEITQYLLDRRTSKNTTQKFQEKDTDDLSLTKELINYEKIKDKTIVSLFTNVMWDTAAIDRDTIFDNVLDWCISTIDWAAQNPQVELFVRLHPADSRYWNVPGAKQLGDEIQKVRQALPTNVHIIESNSKINSYCLAELSNICSTYTSQIGAEIAAMGKPVVIAGDAFYGKQGIGNMPQSKEEYFMLLETKEWIPNDAEEIALRFEHFLYFKMHYAFNMVVEDASKGMGVVTELKCLKPIGNGQLQMNFDTIKEDEELKKIASYVLEGIKDEYDVEEMEVKM